MYFPHLLVGAFTYLRRLIVMLITTQKYVKNVKKLLKNSENYLLIFWTNVETLMKLKWSLKTKLAHQSFFDIHKIWCCQNCIWRLNTIIKNLLDIRFVNRFFVNPTIKVFHGMDIDWYTRFFIFSYKFYLHLFWLPWLCWFGLENLESNRVWCIYLHTID